MNWDQFATVLWLRRRLTANLWRRSGAIGPILAVLMAVGAVVLGFSAFAGGLLGGLFALAHTKALPVQATWLIVMGAFLFFWFIGLLTELQRSETIDLQKLMHLPVALGQLFTINYLASHFTTSIVLFVPGMLGLALGLAISRGPSFLLLLPLALSAVLMVTAWTYCLRGWLGAMMANPRRRRAIVMGITFAFVMLFQLPNLYFNVLRRPEKNARQSVTAKQLEGLQVAFHAQKYVPPFWVSVGARGLAEGRVVPALFGLAGCLALGGLGLRRAYTVTLRAYRGEEAGRKAEVAAPAAPVRYAGTNKRLFVERRLPGVPEEASAVAVATMQSMWRAPEVKMALAMSCLVPIVIGASLLLRSPPGVMPAATRPFVVTGMSMFTVFLTLQFVANPFGYDRSGFRGLLLTPVDRRWFLFGKNLAFLPVSLVTGGIILIASAFWVRLPVLAAVAAGLRLLAMLAIAAIGGNLLSILLPYRVQAGSLKPTKLPGLTMLVMVLCQFLFPVAMLPMFLPPLFQWLWDRFGLPGFVPVDFGLSLLFTAVTLASYWLLLGPLGRLLHRREKRILQAVTAEVE